MRSPFVSWRIATWTSGVSVFGLFGQAAVGSVSVQCRFAVGSLSVQCRFAVGSAPDQRSPTDFSQSSATTSMSFFSFWTRLIIVTRPAVVSLADTAFRVRTATGVMLAL